MTTLRWQYQALGEPPAEPTRHMLDWFVPPPHAPHTPDLSWLYVTSGGEGVGPLHETLPVPPLDWFMLPSEPPPHAPPGSWLYADCGGGGPLFETLPVPPLDWFMPASEPVWPEAPGSWLYGTWGVGAPIFPTLPGPVVPAPSMAGWFVPASEPLPPTADLRWLYATSGGGGGGETPPFETLGLPPLGWFMLPAEPPPHAPPGSWLYSASGGEGPPLFPTLPPVLLHLRTLTLPTFVLPLGAGSVVTLKVWQVSGTPSVRTVAGGSSLTVRGT